MWDLGDPFFFINLEYGIWVFSNTPPYAQHFLDFLAHE